MQLIVVTKLQNVEAPCLDTIGTAARPLAQGADIVPIPGTKRRKYLEENLGAVSLELSVDELAVLDACLAPDKVSGPRYSAKHQAQVDR